MNVIRTWSNVLDEIYRENFFSVDVVYIALLDNTGVITDDSTLRLATGGIDIPIQFTDNTYKTFTAQGDFMGFNPIEDTLDAKLGKFSIQLSGLTSGMVQRFLNKDFEGQRVQVAKIFLNYQTLQNFAQYVIFDGIIYNATITEDEKTCTITIDVATLWADFDRKSGRMTDNNSNWVFQGGSTLDKCFQKSGSVGQISFQWGPKQ